MDENNVFHEIASSLRDINEKVTRTDAIMGTLVGQGGRIPALEADVRELREFRVEAQATVKTTAKATATFWGLISGALGLFGHAIWDIVRGVPHK